MEIHPGHIGSDRDLSTSPGKSATRCGLTVPNRGFWYTPERLPGQACRNPETRRLWNIRLSSAGKRAG